MRVLVTGGGGQLASALAAADGAGIAFHRIGRPAFDFDRPETLARAVDAAAPDAIVNAAAYTGVDAAESDRAAAWRANADGPRRLGELAAARGIRLLHVSTDYVFDGSKGAPYDEADPVSPLGVYGASKLAGERAVLAACPGAIVLRTSWLYAAGGSNFVRTMLAAGRTRPQLRVVADQRGCPTAAADLALAIRAILAGAPDAAAGGVFHAAGSGWTTWHGLACAVFAAAASHGATVPEVIPIGTADWPTPARRPADSRLACDRLAATFGVRLPPWQDSVAATVATILSAG